MILAMARVRILGPRLQLEPVLDRLQDLGLVHLAPPAHAPLLDTPIRSVAEDRRLRYLTRAIEDGVTALRLLGGDEGGAAPVAEPLPRVARLCRRTRREAERLTSRIQGLEEEQALLSRYEAVFRAFEPLLRAQPRFASGRAYHVVVRAGQQDSIARLREELTALLGPAFELRSHPLPADETALIILVPEHAAERVEQLLSAGRVSEVALPAGFAGRTLAEAMPAMQERARQLPAELARARREQADVRRATEPRLRAGLRLCRDAVAQLQARDLSRVTARAFVLEGWLPASGQPRLVASLGAEFGPEVVVEVVGHDHWIAEEAPVVLRNPRLFRPFELLVSLLPLPRYGSIDPTPFVAVFFPMFFGLILGDLGYGAVLFVIGFLLRRRHREEGWQRSLAEILLACAAFTAIFGVVFGEFFGDLGRRWFGLHPLWFDREEAVVPFLILAVSLGAVHMLLGLVIGAVTAFHSHRRTAIGRGLAALMLVLVIVALLASVEVVPHALLTPATIAILVAFPLLVVVEGIVAPVEFLSTLGRVLSYSRIMALGTASVMLAVVANQMAGAFGSALVGVLFALLFHLVNFALGILSPTVHALRLHYVEFFGNFYSPGGVAYRPFSHWTPPRSRAA